MQWETQIWNEIQDPIQVLSECEAKLLSLFSLFWKISNYFFKSQKIKLNNCEQK
jgi:hypothetical protein